MLSAGRKNRFKDIQGFKVEEWKNIYHKNRNYKKAAMFRLIDNIGFKPKLLQGKKKNI